MIKNLEIRPAVDFGHETRSYLGQPVWSETHQTHVFTKESAEAEAMTAMATEGGKSLFWTLYMRLSDGTAQALGDFSNFDGAFEAQSILLAPIQTAAETYGDNTLDNICNHSSLPDRL